MEERIYLSLSYLKIILCYLFYFILFHSIFNIYFTLFSVLILLYLTAFFLTFFYFIFSISHFHLLKFTAHSQLIKLFHFNRFYFISFYNKYHPPPVYEASLPQLDRLFPTKECINIDLLVSKVLEFVPMLVLNSDDRDEPLPCI